MSTKEAASASSSSSSRSVLVPLGSHLFAFCLGMYAHRQLVSGDLELLGILQSAESDRTWRKRLLLLGFGGAVLVVGGGAIRQALHRH